VEAYHNICIGYNNLVNAQIYWLIVSSFTFASFLFVFCSVSQCVVSTLWSRVAFWKSTRWSLHSLCETEKLVVWLQWHIYQELRKSDWMLQQWSVSPVL